MKKGRKKRNKTTDGDMGDNSLYLEVEGESESNFLVLTQNSEAGKKVIKKAKGEVEVDKSIDFFLRKFPLSYDDKD